MDLAGIIRSAAAIARHEQRFRLAILQSETCERDEMRGSVQDLARQLDEVRRLLEKTPRGAEDEASRPAKTGQPLSETSKAILEC
jgi:hypothetical protein